MLYKKSHHGLFRHRSTEILRIEALSDAVFGFSVSLLVASLEVPQTFDELKFIIKGALPFFATVSMLFLFWYQQYVFFRHYGVEDTKTVVLNLCYLAIILFYVYPLKFLFSVLIDSLTGINLFPKATEKGLLVIGQEDFPQLIILFSVGYAAIWLLLYFMHKRVLHFSQKLELNHYELLYTRREKRGALMNVAIGITALLFALIGLEMFSGITYLLIPVALIINQQLFKRQLKRQ
ncbi:MAG: DUF1211 domain-containing protein [Sphingobacteriales bacterium]|nr:DUF1211 domain-containing protein [Sphingobacteriales bacterium]MBI3718401.1 DUF1211 domain-containing protein [Sphingobacteriales bacterium]